MNILSNCFYIFCTQKGMTLPTKTSTDHASIQAGSMLPELSESIQAQTPFITSIHYSRREEVCQWAARVFFPNAFTLDRTRRGEYHKIRRYARGDGYGQADGFALGGVSAV